MMRWGPASAEKFNAIYLYFFQSFPCNVDIDDKNSRKVEKTYTHVLFTFTFADKKLL